MALLALLVAGVGLWARRRARRAAARERLGRAGLPPGMPLHLAGTKARPAYRWVKLDGTVVDLYELPIDLLEQRGTFHILDRNGRVAGRIEAW